MQISPLYSGPSIGIPVLPCSKHDANGPLSTPPLPSKWKRKKHPSKDYCWAFFFFFLSGCGSTSQCQRQQRKVVWMPNYWNFQLLSKMQEANDTENVGLRIWHYLCDQGGKQGAKEGRNCICCEGVVIPTTLVRLSPCTGIIPGSLQPFFW